MSTNRKTILVTGGSGLVGRGIQEALKKDGTINDNEWVFMSSKDCNLL